MKGGWLGVGIRIMRFVGKNGSIKPWLMTLSGL